MKEAINPLSWEELAKFAPQDKSLTEGPNTSYAFKRLFGQLEQNIRVTLYRDNHAWCPYCQKVWLWLEWKRIPYEIKKASMRCYGTKEAWYLKKVPSGMFPAIEIEKRIFTESDRILLALEDQYGALGRSMKDPKTLILRRFERLLFQSWCKWLCSPSLTSSQETHKENEFKTLAKEMEGYLSKANGPWLDPAVDNLGQSTPGSADVIFIPYLERMNASLAYYKGFNLRKEFPAIDKWLSSLEATDVYRGTQGDFHTHAHDLPPQMGSCWANNEPIQKEMSSLIDSGKGLGPLETTYEQTTPPPEAIALARVLKHRSAIMNSNPMGALLIDQPLRAALSRMISSKAYYPEEGSAIGLRYLKDRISVPRDMPVIAARKLRQALEYTASLDSSLQGPAIPINNRLDQDPRRFRNE
ncbi:MULTISPECIES: glutathione S-transferase family protein [Prochlorococcus]|uniref:glutathione S-transferase family protein n=1 Tax=Prochlorococcus TaxID=1218 RepID=UPI000533852C|nr:MULTISPECIES: glutathione S-transferase N-terminal domain-containing protein [Prochlorococcus]KGG12820.1 Glutaredoxin-like domain/phycoerythrin related domain fusion [Prochlorococcus sp. MIT 0601]